MIIINDAISPSSQQRFLCPQKITLMIIMITLPHPIQYPPWVSKAKIHKISPLLRKINSPPHCYLLWSAKCTNGESYHFVHELILSEKDGYSFIAQNYRGNFLEEAIRVYLKKLKQNGC